MKRLVQAELLDTLPPDDPRAVRSRRDLRRVNAWMGNAGLLARALAKHLDGHAPGHITELGAGDGKILLTVAKKILMGQPASRSSSSGWTATLLDLQKTVSPETLAAFAALGWRAETVIADVFDWPSLNGDIVVTNLFLHHFEEPRLADLLRTIARHARLFIALEPRRAPWPLFCSRLLWAIGCNDVTRHDAVVSVRAGFARTELSALWPMTNHWRLTEQSAGPFSHLFVARRSR